MLLTITTLQTQISQALVYGLNPAETAHAQMIQIPANQKLTNIVINPTFQGQYAELLVPAAVVKKIQTALKNSAVNITVELTIVKNNYRVIFTAKTLQGKTVASKTFTSITNKNRATIPATTPYAHTNVKYQLNNNAYTEIKFITQNPFTIPVSIAK